MKRLLKLSLFTILFCFIFVLNVSAKEDTFTFKAMGFTTQTLEPSKIVSTTQKPDIYVTEADIYLMSQTVFAESGGEPYEGKVAVASVILNRVRAPGFPKSVSGVILQKDAFSCVINGKVNTVPNESSYLAVLEALRGEDPTYKAVFFYNPKTATSIWMLSTKKQDVKAIGNHVFFKV
ncbi:MAG TPA: cell wall hydrolase [Clostridiaceae bacterium]